MIALPLVGRLQVAGLNLADLERAITDAYVPSYVKTVSVFAEVLATDEPTTVLVRGAAGTPGLVSLKNNQRNIMYALSSAGGFGPGASGKVRVRPIRSDEEEVLYDFGNADDVRRALLRPPLESGDMLLVEAAPVSAIYVLGLVNAQGPVPVPPGSKLSVVQAIAHAGGLRDFLEPKEATLRRTLPNGQEVRVKLNIAQMLAGERASIDLFPGDILEVPHTADTRFREWAMANVKLGPFGVGAFYDPVTYSTFKDRSHDVGWGRTLGTGLIFSGTNYLFSRAVPTP
jgi:protein involved in polysaccharide export with SLBB domain